MSQCGRRDYDPRSTSGLSAAAWLGLLDVRAVQRTPRVSSGSKALRPAESTWQVRENNDSNADNPHDSNPPIILEPKKTQPGYIVIW